MQGSAGSHVRHACSLRCDAADPSSRWCLGQGAAPPMASRFQRAGTERRPTRASPPSRRTRHKEYGQAAARSRRAASPPHGVLSGLCGHDPSLNTRQQPMRLGQVQAQVGDAGGITKPVDPHDVRVCSFTLSTGLHQPPCRPRVRSRPRTSVKVSPSQCLRNFAAHLPRTDAHRSKADCKQESQLPR